MEETISTTSEVSTEQTTPDVTEETTQPVETEQTTEETGTQEPENATTTETETGQPTQEPPKDWEKIAKDNQAAYTRVSQELAQLKKAQEPQYVDERGKITPQYEQQYRFDIDNREFLAYDQLARQLEPDTRAEVESLLEQAKAIYNPNNKRAYEQKLNEIKDYFRADIVEQIALDKRTLENQMQVQFDKMTNEYRVQKSKEIVDLVEQSDDLKALLYQDSENYSADVFGIVKQMFDLTGGVDLNIINNAVSSIKELGVKEYLAKQKAEAEKAKATVPTGGVETQLNSQNLTPKYAREHYKEAVEKFGMDKVDAIIMKG